MHKLFTTIFIITFLLINLPFTQKAFGQTSFKPDKQDFDKAEKLLRKMSIDEKIGQMVHIGINGTYLHQDSLEYRVIKRQITENNVGGIIVFVGGVYETVHLVNRMQEASKIPLLVSADFETGVGMRFFETTNLPWNMAITATGNPDFARQAGVITAREARALGVRQVYAPVVDVNNNSANPVINVRSFGENPVDVARFGVEFSKGLQSENVIATAKHFPGHGDTAVDSHRGLPVIDFSRERLEKTEFLPFRELIKNGVGAVMISHISLPKIDSEIVKPLDNSIRAEYTESEIITNNTTMPATLSKKIVNDILKNDLSFDGLVVTDAMDMSGLTIYFDQGEAAVRAILAGNDILIKPALTDATIDGIKKAVKSGRITEQRIDESVRKILAWKYKLGLFKQKITPIEKIDQIVSGQETNTLADEISKKAITLVKNEDQLFPVSSDKNIAVICITNGPDINRTGLTFTSELSSNGITAKRIALDSRSNKKEIANAISQAKKADIVVLGLFGRVRSGAKNSVGIPAPGEEVVNEILKSDVKSISIAFGNPYLILGFPAMKNYVVSYGDMDSLQRATARAILGKIDFNGKLPITVGEYPRGTGLKIKK